jgi:2-methylcitrate dehydratase PrpD
VVPAAIAVAAETGASSAALSRAVLRGTEAAVWLGSSTGKVHRQRFQSTSTCGGVGAALACADLYGLTAAQTAAAMANVASTAGGLWAFVDEECAGKQWHAGHAAHSAVLCAQLASSGLTGPLGVIDSTRGFHAVLCEDPAPGELAPQGNGWAVHEVAYKPWPCPRPTHATVLAALKAREAVGASEICAVRVRTFGLAVDLCNRTSIRTAHDARFSLQFLAAAALRDGRVDFGTFRAESLEAIRPMVPLIHVEVDPSINAAYPAQSMAEVEVELANGERITRRTDHAPGDPQLPLRAREEDAKRQMLLAGDAALGQRVAQFGTAGTSLRDQLGDLFAGSGIRF